MVIYDFGSFTRLATAFGKASSGVRHDKEDMTFPGLEIAQLFEIENFLFLISKVNDVVKIRVILLSSHCTVDTFFFFSLTLLLRGYVIKPKKLPK